MHRPNYRPVNHKGGTYVPGTVGVLDRRNERLYSGANPLQRRAESRTAHDSLRSDIAETLPVETSSKRSSPALALTAAAVLYVLATAAGGCAAPIVKYDLGESYRNVKSEMQKEKADYNAAKAELKKAYDADVAELDKQHKAEMDELEKTKKGIEKTVKELHDEITNPNKPAQPNKK